MRKLFVGLVISLVSLATTTFAQEQKEEKAAPAKEAAAPAKAEGMKCCEGMEKMGEMKAGMPMKGEMKTKMEAMKQKMAEKMAEKEPQTKASKGEETQSTKDAHQH